MIEREIYKLIPLPGIDSQLPTHNYYNSVSGIIVVLSVL